MRIVESIVVTFIISLHRNHQHVSGAAFVHCSFQSVSISVIGDPDQEISSDLDAFDGNLGDFSVLGVGVLLLHRLQLRRAPRRLEQAEQVR